MNNLKKIIYFQIFRERDILFNPTFRELINKYDA